MCNFELWIVVRYKQTWINTPCTKNLIKSNSTKSFNIKNKTYNITVFNLAQIRISLII